MTALTRPETMSQMYDLEPLETMDMLIEDGTHEFVTRVPGGWLFTRRSLGVTEEGKEFYAENVTFVPFHEEFYLWKRP